MNWLSKRRGHDYSDGATPLCKRTDGRRMDHGQSALTQLKAYLAQLNLPENARLPAERELCDVLGVSRGELRKALALLEAEGEVWRHVGKGTFLGARPPDGTFDHRGRRPAGRIPPR